MDGTAAAGPKQDPPGARAPRPAIFFDRDGVLNRLLPGAYVTGWDLFEWLPRAREALAEAHGRGWTCVVVTNQAGVGRGLQTQAGLDAIHKRMCAEAREAGGRIAAVYACPHIPDAGCECRKPRPGLLLRAARDLGLDLGASWLMGDSPADLEAAEGAGVAWLLVAGGPRPVERQGRAVPTDRVCADALDAVRRIGTCPRAR